MRLNQHRRFPARRPSPPYRGPLRDSAFVLEENSGSSPPRVFLLPANARPPSAAAPPRCVPAPAWPAAAGSTTRLRPPLSRTSIAPLCTTDAGHFASRAGTTSTATNFAVSASRTFSSTRRTARSSDPSHCRMPLRSARSGSAPQPDPAISPTLPLCAVSCLKSDASRTDAQDGLQIALTKSPPLTYFGVNNTACGFSSIRFASSATVPYHIVAAWQAFTQAGFSPRFTRNAHRSQYSVGKGR